MFEHAPVVEGFDPEEMDQGEEFLNLVLAAVEISNVGTPDPMQDLHRSTGEAPAVVTFKLEARLRALRRPVLNRVCFI